VAMKLGMDDYNNPIRDLRMNADNVPNFMKVLGSAYANLKILDNLALRTQYGVDYSMWYERIIQKKWAEAGGKSSDVNGVTQNTWQNLGRTWTNTLTYNLNLGQHKVDAVAGVESYSFITEDLKGYRQNVLLENRDYGYLNATTSSTSYTLNGGGSEVRLFSYFGKINYAFDAKYLLSLTMRRDGASVFGANNRYGTFPAVSAGWRISDEKFMKDVGFVSDLKLRASWGQNGNSAPLSAGKLVNIYTTDLGGTSYPIDGSSTNIPSGYRRASLGNPDLKWETTEQLNLGVDFSLLTNRLRGSFDWFNKKTFGMLFEPPYIAALGEGGYRWVNAADMNNKGFELLLSWGESKKDFSYTITTNLSAFKNRVGKVPENVKYAYGGNGLLDYIEGRPLHSYYGLVADGLFRTQKEVDDYAAQNGKGLGRIRYRDLDGDGTVSELYDRAWIGVWDPRLAAGLNFEARYKNFDITVFFQGVFGNQIYNNWKELSDFWNISVQNDRNHPSRILDAWTPDNPNSTIPALSRGDANGEKRLSSYYIENGSYLKLRTVDIGYTLPPKLISRLGIQQLRMYISGQNLMTLTKSWGDDKFTGLDPETGFNYPLPVNAYFGVNLTF
ncbi:MAG: SusC/RagA family TonB-linked outer membrane protein, partial [Flavihumibacter sp.]